jgi:hypothetical protein
MSDKIWYALNLNDGERPKEYCSLSWLLKALRAHLEAAEVGAVLELSVEVNQYPPYAEKGLPEPSAARTASGERDER